MPSYWENERETTSKWLGKAEAQPCHTVYHWHGDPQLGENSKSGASPCRVKGSQCTLGIPTFKTGPWEMSPQNVWFWRLPALTPSPQSLCLTKAGRFHFLPPLPLFLFPLSLLFFLSYFSLSFFSAFLGRCHFYTPPLPCSSQWMPSSCPPSPGDTRLVTSFYKFLWLSPRGCPMIAWYLRPQWPAFLGPMKL